MQISDEAVEAAVKVIRADTDKALTAPLPDLIRTILEAAATYIAADAWDEAAASIIDEHGNPIKPTNVDNPYRSQA